jgi:mono/diheme cytochrome c family protein
MSRRASPGSPRRRRVGGAAAVLVAALIGAAAQPASAVEDVAQAEAGSKIANGLCAKCHAVGRSMVSPVDAAPPFRAMAEDPALTEQAIRQLLRTSHQTMPDYIFSLDEQEAIAAYIRSLARR